MKKKLHYETALSHDGNSYYDNHGAILPPIYQNSLYAFESWDDIDAAFEKLADNFVYSRILNPTVSKVEENIADIPWRTSKVLCFWNGSNICSYNVFYHCIIAVTNV